MSSPPTPEVSVITRHLFESPWLLMALLAATGAVAIVAGVRRRKAIPAVVGLTAFVLAAAVWITARTVETIGEAAARVTRDLVTRAEQANVPGVLGYFTDEATFALGDPRNPGLGRDAIEDLVEQLEGRYRISENAITRLVAYTTGSNTAEVHLRCRTIIDFERGIGVPVATGWILRFEREPGGAPSIVQLTFVDYDGQTPTMDVIR
jgi:hypothetical protein